MNLLPTKNPQDILSLLGRTAEELAIICGKETSKLKIAEDEVISLEKLKKLKENNSMEQLTEEIHNLKDAKRDIIFKMSEISNTSAEFIEQQLQKASSI